MNEHLKKFADWLKVELIPNEETYELSSEECGLTNTPEMVLVTSADSEGFGTICVVETVDTHELIQVTVIDSSETVYVPDGETFRIKN